MAARKDLDVAAVVGRFQEVPQQFDGRFEIIGVPGGRDDVQFAFQLRRQRKPILFQLQANVVLLPMLRDALVNRAADFADELARTAVGAARAEDRVE